jgi:hypothetical protein
MFTLPNRSLSSIPSSTPTEQKVGYTIFGLYIVQFMLGVFIHAVRVPFLFIAHRPPQNYLHAVLGLAILALAAYQVRVFCYRSGPILFIVREIDSLRAL